jgi:hypothetical protein
VNAVPEGCQVHDYLHSLGICLLYIFLLYVS